MDAAALAAQFGVSERAAAELLQRCAATGLRETDLEEKFVRSSGPGGQNVNKVSTCVHLRHLPTGLTVRCQSERSQARNRFLARRRLADKLEELRTGLVRARQAAAEKLRRQKRKRSARAKAKMLDAKRRVSAKKAQRRPPAAD